MLDPRIYDELAVVHEGAAQILDLVSPWVIESVFYTDLRKTDNERIVSIQGQNLTWWFEFVVEECHRLFSVLGPNIIIEVQQIWEDGGLYKALPESIWNMFQQAAPPATIRLVNPQGLADGQAV
jgi:predicted ATPase